MLPPQNLVSLARALGDPKYDLAILAEGNCSARGDSGAFWVKASGRSMVDAGPQSFVSMQSKAVAEALDQSFADDRTVRAALDRARVDPTASQVASTEAFMHAWLLGLDGIEFVGHTHPTDLLALLATDQAERIAGLRLFPDEIVCCGPATCWVEYVMPGLTLARAIRARVEEFRERLGILPKTIWLQNHGLIALGSSPSEVMSASRMTVKAARVWLGALATQKPLQTLTEEEIAQIYQWPDEHFRQKQMWASDGSVGGG